MEEDILKYINKITKKATMPKRILEHFILMGTSTVSDIAKNIDVSLPTAAAALNDLRKWERKKLQLVAYLCSMTSTLRRAIL